MIVGGKPPKPPVKIVGPRIVRAEHPRRRREWPEVEVSKEVWDFFRKMGIKTVPEDEPPTT